MRTELGLPFGFYLRLFVGAAAPAAEFVVKISSINDLLWRRKNA